MTDSIATSIAVDEGQTKSSLVVFDPNQVADIVLAATIKGVQMSTIKSRMYPFAIVLIGVLAATGGTWRIG